MISGTTPTLTCRLSDSTINLEEADDVFFTITQGSTSITKTGENLEVSGNSVAVWLTQEDTFKMRPGYDAKIQLNWIYRDGDGIKRMASKVKQITVDEQLLMRVIE